MSVVSFPPSKTASDPNQAAQEIHPLLRLHRPVVTTPPILALANAIRSAMEDGHQGLRVLGSARVGKTFAQHWLLERQGWIEHPLARVAVRIPRHAKIKDGYVYQLILLCCRQRLQSRQSDLDLLARVRNLFEELCVRAGTKTLLLLVDESQRLFQEELIDFLAIVDESEAWGINVFVVFVQQTDVSGNEGERVREQLAVHIKGRIGMADHPFHGIRGEVETATVLGRYDDHAKWPLGSAITYTAYFARDAYLKGFRLAKYTKQILESVERLRAAHGLGALVEWPMKTFELFVQRLLTRIVVRPGFDGLTQDDIDRALDESGYLALEFCRANLIDDVDE